jgi:diaminohydroxyphosphoribosylaminopyrimidine deaminase/5-amino-6-(5-phosphoribosylamino)uracil reductase
MSLLNLVAISEKHHRVQIPKVVIGALDTNSKVAGNGIEALKTAGCDVTVGVLEKECKIHHKRFFTFHNKKRPYIVLKWAETQDGYLAPLNNHKQKPFWISNIYSRQLVDKWRSEEQAILVGTNTVLADNPSLTVRDWTGQNPIRIVLDRDDKLQKDRAIFNNTSETIIITKNDIDYSKDIASQVCTYLYEKEIQSVIIEGGSKTLQSFINEKLWDEARVFTGKMALNQGIKAPKLKGKLISECMIMDDHLKTYLND